MTDFYETNEQLGQYMDFHFGPEHFGVANYPRVCAERCLSAAKARGSALDLGCATGRSTLELARGFESVVGWISRIGSSRPRKRFRVMVS